jgi:AraC-like DNA-binding protein
LSPISSTSSPALLFKFIDFIEVKLRKAECGMRPDAIHFNNDADIFVGIIKGNVTGNEMPDLAEGSFYFNPGKRNYVPEDGPIHNMPSEKTSFQEGNSKSEQNENIVSYLVFDTVLYQAFPFFQLLDLPPFIIPPDKKFEFLLKEICTELNGKKLGREVIIKNYCSELMVQIFRHLNSKPGFEKVINKLQYLTDARLIGIVEYIRENLEKELSNASLAKVAGVSDEYVGQYFKSLTGRTLQEYIESQRMERAIHLLQTIPNNVHEIAAMVGFSDAAYFSRRFKMHFKINANTFRKKKSTKPGMNEQHQPMP